MRNDSSRHQVGAFHIRVDDFAPVFICGVDQGVLGGINSRAVEYVIYPAKVSDYRFHALGGASWRCHI